MSFLVRAEDFHDHEGGEHPEGGTFWGNAGAGCVFYAEDTKKICIQKRSPHVKEPGTWGTFGGAIEEGETPVEGLKREIQEETSYKGTKKIVTLNVYKNGNFSFHNFVVRVPKEFKPKAEPEHAWETSGHKWTTIDKLPKPLHFGMKNLLPSLEKYLEENP